MVCAGAGVGACERRRECVPAEPHLEDILKLAKVSSLGGYKSDLDCRPGCR